LGAVGAAAVLLFWLYWRQAATIWISSDGASNALQAWDMLHGNAALHGWWLSDVSFYTTELPEYALVEAVRGLNPQVIQACAALTYTLLVVFTGLLGMTTAGSPRQKLARGLLAAGIVLAPSAILGTPMLISSPNHTGTAVPLLLTLLLMDFAPQGFAPHHCARQWARWWMAPLAVGLLLAWVQVADQVALYAGAIPVAMVCGLRWAWQRWRGPLGAADGAERLDLAFAVAAAASVPLALAALRVIRALGGFYVHPVAGGLFAPLSQLGSHARLLGESVLALFGANFYTSGESGALRAIALVHLAGVAVVVLGLVVAARLLLAGRLDRVSSVLLAGILIVLAAGLLSTHMTDVLSANEIEAITPFGAALTGRIVGGWLARPRRAALLAAGLAAYLAFLCYDGTLPLYGKYYQPVANWLVAHNMRDGLALYWQSDVMTLATDGRVTVAPVTLDNGGAAYHWESKAGWFDPGTRYANFMITVPWPTDGSGTSDTERARALFGPPTRVYRVDGWDIQVWNHNLLPQVSHATQAALGRSGSQHGG